MGFFSWKTSDTSESIPSVYSDRRSFTVHLITRDGQIYTEHNYQGYGEFGGMDIYLLIANLNKIKGDTDDKKRSAGIDLCFKNNPDGSFQKCADKGLIMPKIVTHRSGSITSTKSAAYKKWFDSFPYPDTCEYQGYFYEDCIEL